MANPPAVPNPGPQKNDWIGYCLIGSAVLLPFILVYEWASKPAKPAKQAYFLPAYNQPLRLAVAPHPVQPGPVQAGGFRNRFTTEEIQRERDRANFLNNQNDSMKQDRLDRDRRQHQAAMERAEDARRQADAAIRRAEDERRRVEAERRRRK
jgi:hypothetical protein